MKIFKILPLASLILIAGCSSSSPEVGPTPVEPTRKVDNFSIYKTKVDFDLGDKMYFDDLTLTCEYNDGAKETFTYSLFNEYGFSCSILFDNHYYSMDETFSKAGIWELVVYETENKDNKQSLDIRVYEDLLPQQMQYTYKDYMDHNIYQFDSTPCLGEAKLLIVPVWFTDSSDFIDINSRENVREDIRISYLGSQEETGWHSVKSYYEEESLHRLTMNGVVTDWYECGYSATMISNNFNYIISIINGAIAAYFASPDSDPRASFDCDENGYLDGIILIYGAPDASLYPFSSNLWAFTSWLMNPPSVSPNKATPNVFFWASYDFMYSYGDQAYARTNKTSYGNSDTRYANIDAHTFIHETGHCLGLEDYYDYSGQYSPAAGFSMQDYNVGGHDPFSVMALGWAEPFVPTESTLIKLNTFQETHELVVLSPSFNDNGSPFDEYIILELYSPTGLNELDSLYRYDNYYPQGPNKVGIRIWHVDARLVKEKNGDLSYPYTVPDTGVYHMMSNSYDSSGSILGKNYYNYNLLQLIHNNTRINHKNSSTLSNSSLFYEGDIFNMERYSRQFVKSGLLNSGLDLGWEVEVLSIKDNVASLKLTKI